MTLEINHNPPTPPTPPVKPSLWTEIVKGWEWVVFTWKMLGRLGGPLAIAQTLFSTLTMLMQRTWRQLGNNSKK